HESLLVEWGRASLSLFKAVVAADFGQAALGYASAVVIIFTHLNRGGDVASILLLTYWTLSLPSLGQEIGLILRRYPTYRNVVLRLMEPLGAPEESTANNQQPAASSQRPIIRRSHRHERCWCRGGREHDFAGCRFDYRIGPSRGHRGAIGRGQIEPGGAAVGLASRCPRAVISR
ncbi:MAG: hypothetical protein P8183_18620, partial [Anaerolineae bacterium]